MEDEYNGWGASTVATAYMYQRIHDILNVENIEEMPKELSELYRELAHNFHVDTGVKVGVHLDLNKSPTNEAS